jgi:hypothetical protein
VLGIYTLGSGIAASQGALLSISFINQGGRFARIVAFLPSFLLLALSGYLWIYAEIIAARMFPDEESAEHPSGAAPEVLKRIAFVVVGILILNGAFSGLVNTITNMLMRGAPRNTVYSLVYLVETVVRLVLGFWLIFGSQRLRSWWTVGAQRLEGLTKKDW